MDILKMKRVTDGGDRYLSNAIGYCFKEKPEPGEELIETIGYGVSNRSPKLASSQMYAGSRNITEKLAIIRLFTS